MPVRPCPTCPGLVPPASRRPGVRARSARRDPYELLSERARQTGGSFVAARPPSLSALAHHTGKTPSVAVVDVSHLRCPFGSGPIFDLVRPVLLVHRSNGATVITTDHHSCTRPTQLYGECKPIHMMK